MKACFFGVKFNGKANWTPPVTKSENGEFDLGEVVPGKLDFSFTINPPLFKQHQVKLAALAEIEAAKPQPKKKKGDPEPPKPKAPEPLETFDQDFLLKPPITEAGMTRLLDMLVDSYKDEDENNAIQLVTNLAKEHTLWTSQAFEILHVFKN